MLQRFGIGYDSHRFGAERPLKLGGVEIEHESGLQGHSDGDALCHAITDALLGAAAMGDIGQLFPDDEDRWKDADSIGLLAEARRRVVAAAYTVVNVDAVIITEAPKLAPYIPEMRERLAGALRIEKSSVSVKAKTNEKMDAIGGGEGLAVYAIASLGGA